MAMEEDHRDAALGPGNNVYSQVVDSDGIDDDDHDVLTGSNADGTYAGFSCEDWTSTTATDGDTTTTEPSLLSRRRATTRPLA